MSDYKVYYGIENLHLLDTCITIAFDTETLQLQPERGKLRLLQLGCKVRKVVVLIDVFELETKDLERLRNFISSPERYWLAHNAVFDLAWLQEYGFHPKGRIGDTMLASRLLNNGIPNLRHRLDSVVKRYLKRELSKEEQLSDWSAPVLTESQLSYAAADVIALCELDSP